MGLDIENDRKKLIRLDKLMSEYWEYIKRRENQPLAAEVVALVCTWITDNIKEFDK